MIPWDKIAVQYNYKSAESMMRDLYEKRGLSVDSLAKRFGCSNHAIRGVLSKMGVQVKQRGHEGSSALNKITPEDFKERGARSIADQLGLDITTVYKHFKKRQSELQPPPEPTSLGTEEP